MKATTYLTRRLLLGTILLSACFVLMVLAGALSNQAQEQPGMTPGNIAYAQEPTPTLVPVSLCGGRIGSGDSLTGTLLYSSASCEFVFDGTAGAEVEITMRAVSGDLDPLLTLIDPNGQIVAQNDDLSSSDRNSLISYTLPQDGAYTIVAGSYDNASSGAFQLTLSAVRIRQFRFGCGGAIAYGQTAQDSIGTAQTHCDYTFYGDAGEVIAISLVSVDGDLDPLLRLLGVDGAILVENDDVDGTNSAISDFALPQSGTYTAQALAYENQSSGRFQLTLTSDTTGPTPAPTPPSCGGFIQAGQVRSDRLSNQGERCSYWFDGQAGDVVTIRMDKVSESLDPVIELYAPSDGGQAAASNDDAYRSNSIIWRYRLRENGQYEIRAHDYGSGTGNYKLLLAKGLFQRGNTVQQIYSRAVIRRTLGDINKPQGDIIANVPIDTTLTVVGGPQTANSLTWWQVRYTNASRRLITGWMADARATGQPILAPAMP